MQNSCLNFSEYENLTLNIYSHEKIYMQAILYFYRYMCVLVCMSFLNFHYTLKQDF